MRLRSWQRRCRNWVRLDLTGLRNDVFWLTERPFAASCWTNHVSTLHGRISSSAGQLQDKLQDESAKTSASVAADVDMGLLTLRAEKERGKGTCTSGKGSWPSGFFKQAGVAAATLLATVVWNALLQHMENAPCLQDLQSSTQQHSLRAQEAMRSTSFIVPSTRTCQKTIPSTRDRYQGRPGTSEGLSQFQQGSRIHRSLTQGDTGSVPVHIGTRTLVARYDDLHRCTIPMPTFSRRPSTISSLFPDVQQDSTAKTADIGTAFRSIPYTFLHFYVGRRFKTQRKFFSSFPSEAVMWIKEVVMVNSVDQLTSSRSIAGETFPNFEMLDARIACALNKIIQNTQFKKKVSLEEQRAQKEDRFLRRKTDRFNDLQQISSHWCSWCSSRLCRFALYHSWQ